MRSIDLNADLGEGFGRYRLPDADALLGLVSSANIACGFHAGDPMVMRETVAGAVHHSVTVGAHPGYHDLRGFGRRETGSSPAEIEQDVLYQIGALHGFAVAAGTQVRYVKPHGALYLRACRDSAAADAIAGALRAFDPDLVLLGLPGTELERAADRATLRFAREAFVDRAYLPDGHLVPRSEPGSVLHDVAVCVERAVRLVLDGQVEACNGEVLEIVPDSLCVHGDGPTALTLLRAVRDRLTTAGVELSPFA